MYSDTTTPTMKTAQSRSVLLQRADVRVDIRDYLSRTRMAYHFLNAEDVNIEAVYTFPLPIDGVLTALHIQIGEREMHGVAVEKSQAQEDYEQAISEGDSPIMLERLDSGLYSLNVGNILPGEKAAVTIEFLEVLCPKGDEVRYELPTTLAPLYGDPAARGLAPHQHPAHSIFADNRFSLEVDIRGCLAGADIQTLAHATRLERDGGHVRLTLSEPAASMDRDFIMTLRSDALPQAFAVSAPDKDGYVVLAGFTPRFAAASPARSVKIVVDCSGSMGGESILQARQALLRALDRLRPEDRFNIVRFGSSSTMLFRKQEPADETHLQAAMAMARTMEADMGGTEMADALDKALSSASPNGMPEDILLVTDGQVWDMAAVADRLVRRKHRVFCIGVGSAVERGVLTTLAKKTSGEAIFVNVHEDMGKKVFEHFKRMTLTPAGKPAFDFADASPQSVAPKNLPPVFDGDMVLTCAWFKTLPQGTSFSLETPEGPTTWHTPIHAAEDYTDTLPRFAASMKLQDLPDDEATALAVEYNLISPFTNFLVIMERADADKPESLPRLRTVAHNVPHGWGGVGAMTSMELFSMAPPVSASCLRDAAPEFIYRERSSVMPSAGTWLDTIPARAIPAIRQRPDMEVTFDMLAAWGVPEDILDALREISDHPTEPTASSRPTERTLALSLLLIAAKRCGAIPRDDVRLLRKALGKVQTNGYLEARIERLIHG
jgi:Ca-activated chloride channel family protein